MILCKNFKESCQQILIKQKGRLCQLDSDYQEEAPKKDLITGQGFEADPGLKNWTIRHNVQGQFIRDENDKKN